MANLVFMSDLQPGLSGALFLFYQKKKKAGTEDGKAALIIILKKQKSINKADSVYTFIKT